MAHPLTFPMIGALALAGVGVGIQLGYSAVGEINPMYFSKPETRFHADLSAAPPSFASAAAPMPGQVRDFALGTGCLGCRTYPEEYFPIHEASLGGYSGGYASEATAAEPTAAEEQPDPEAARLRQDIERVGVYAQGPAAEPSVRLASAQTEAPTETESEALPTSE
jgi:hypothetical protein